MRGSAYELGAASTPRSVSLAVLAVVSTLTGCTPASRASRAQLGEPIDGYPSWAERVVHVWTNRARAEPVADLASCTACSERACYTTPTIPLGWSLNHARAARFHSTNLALAGCGQHDSPCTLVSDIASLYESGACNGAPSCACVGGTATCGPGGTTWTTRVGLFGGNAGGENVAGYASDPLTTFYQWLHEPDPNPACGYRTSNGHRRAILEGTGSIGVGRSTDGLPVWTMDFGGAPVNEGIVDGVHYPQSGSSVAFRANWYSTGAPLRAQVNVDGACQTMTLERGSNTNGTYLYETNRLSTSCVHYVFSFEDPNSTSFTFPTVGSFAINCAADWETTVVAPCGDPPPVDAGTPAMDVRTSVPDAGSPVVDVMTVALDVGTPPVDSSPTAPDVRVAPPLDAASVLDAPTSVVDSSIIPVVDAPAPVIDSSSAPPPDARSESADAHVSVLADSAVRDADTRDARHTEDAPANRGDSGGRPADEPVPGMQLVGSVGCSLQTAKTSTHNGLAVCALSFAVLVVARRRYRSRSLQRA